ncbi:MAG TPA: diaminopimelate decarboxylase [Pyrinomonadaceae bacterium]|nr:diaminopimelate decarboxylase [Pyrinomonadaceae bacterium]
MTKPWEIENFLEVRDEQLYIDGVSAVALAEQYGTPLFVVSESRIRHNIARIKKAENSIGCPLKICYAGKANSTMAVLRAVKDAGSDIEVNSGGELWKALKIGFAPEQIIFNGTSKEVWEIENAINAGIYAIQVDSIYELSVIEETARGLGKRANVSLRLVPEIEAKTHAGLKTALLTSKFGMMPDEAYAAIRDRKDSPHLDFCGIHLHIGSQNPEAEPYAEAFKMLFESLVHIHNETGIKLKHINLGGGFPVNYLRDRSLAASFPREQLEMFSADFDPADAIVTAWNVVKDAAASSNAEPLLEDFTLLLEPGRSIISDAGICLTSVRNRKQRPISDSSISPHLSSLSDDHWLLTDAGFNILLSMETYKWYYHLISASRAGDDAEFPYKVAGPLCDGGDVYFDIEGQDRLPDYRPLPENIQPGEVLALLNCGAYSLAQASQYNARFLPPVALIRENGEAEVVRKRDDFEDLVSNDIY